ncbi:aryl-sulfate sulfotransferase [Lacinutrix jangbogonensis]|uniref:aryl-sulfate sulfotransferase n=1 Tax=Lacinutrix jangbogonensis TaxID=1469557 RepID=UPI001F153D08|nr:aryl-sulfate sulfotransferase [Lacinutrix jangbogonensis]
MRLIILIPFFLTTVVVFSQNTVGTLLNTEDSYNGYTLLSPIRSTETYLINNCGEVINQWSSTFLPGASVYLLEDGSLLRTGKVNNSEINLGGLGGKIELFDWNGNIIWEYLHSSTTFSQHHDIYPLPNGNILMLSAEIMTQQEAIQAGRDPLLLSDGKLYNEQILELEPVGINQANIVWEWNIKDHLIQDLDINKDNFGIIENNPQLLNINFLNGGNPVANWLHINSIQFSETLDQIILSSRKLSEIYIIDHSTTTLEASSSNGGTYNKGGDFLYRWGNLEAYGKGTNANQTLDSQHYPHWIPDSLTDEGKIMIFNNGNSTGISSLEIINPPTSLPGEYIYNTTNGYGPLTSEWNYTSPIPTDFFSSILSSGQRLPNGNTLICDGDSGYFIEIDNNKDIVWEYVNPDTADGILSQGETPTTNFVFRALKFPLDYPAFIGRDLTPGDPIEINPDLSDCNLLNVLDYTLEKSSIKLYPNPVVDYLTIEYPKKINSIEVYTIFGKLLKKVRNTKKIKFSKMASGFYLVKINTDDGSITKKIVKA